MSTSYVRLNVIDKVGYIEFYNPPHNGLPASMLASLTNLITKAGSDPSIAVVVSFLRVTLPNLPVSNASHSLRVCVLSRVRCSRP